MSEWISRGAGVGFLVLTWIVSLPAIILRIVLWVLLVSMPASFAYDGGQTTPGWTVVGMVLFGFGPVAASAVAFVAGGAGVVERWRTGSRRPSVREEVQLRQAFDQLGLGRGPRVRILDIPTETEAYVLGRTVFVSRQLVRSPALAAVLAHECGHAATWDGALSVAQWWVPIMPLYQAGVALNGCLLGWLGWLLRAASGLWCLRILGPVWMAYWRHREYAADKYAARLGQGEALAAELERWQVLDTAVPFAFLVRTHPYTELRIDRLLTGREVGRARMLPAGVWGRAVAALVAVAVWVGVAVAVGPQIASLVIGPVVIVILVVAVAAIGLLALLFY